MLELRLLFVAGLLGLGGLAAVVGALLAGLAERLRSHRRSAADATVKRGSAPATRRGVIGHAGR